MTGGAPRIGIDLVRIDRLSRAGVADDLVARAVLGEAELRWALADPGSAVGLAAGVALKEATVKCAGGRWSGFDWRHIRIVRARPGLGRDPAEAMVAGLRVDRCRPVTIRFPGVDGTRRARGAWGRCADRGADLVVAVVVADQLAVIGDPSRGRGGGWAC